MLTNKKTCEVAVHFNSAPHSLQDFEFQCIDQIAHANSRTLLENTLITKEAYWSAQLFTLSPYGLNKRQEFHSKTESTTIKILISITPYSVPLKVFRAFRNPIVGSCYLLRAFKHSRALAGEFITIV